MKKIGLFLLYTLLLFELTACFKISTPEDLLASPELRTEKKEMKEAVDKFRPLNSVTYPVTMSKEKKSMSMVIKDLDADSTTEIISFYKSKSDDKIGMFILKKVDALWVKKADIMFNSYEIGNIFITDLNNDDKREIIIESYETENKSNPRNYSIVYFDNKDIKVIKEIPYVVMEIADINSDGYKELFSITKEGNNSDYILNIDFFNGKSIEAYRQKTLKNMKNPYNMVIGNVYSNQMAIFADYIGENGYENTMIWMFKKGEDELIDFKDFTNLDMSNYHFNLQSRDIDNDGIIEVGYKFKSPNYSMPILDIKEVGLVNGYFKINKDKDLELVREVYEEYAYTINFPKTFRGKYSINISKDGLETDINFINHLGKEYPLIKVSYIKKYEWQKDNELRKDMQIIAETQDNVIAGKLMDYSDSLDEKDKEIYLRMRTDASILSNIIKERIY